MRRRSLVLLAVLAFGIGSVPAAGQSVPADRPHMRAEPLTRPLVVDGQLDEPVYHQAVPFSAFVQYEPANGQPATESSDAWVFFDEDNVYVAVRNWDSHPERMVANELRHDSTALTQNEQISVTLDTFHDGRNGFVFLVSALGGMLEESFADERNPSRDWNAIWDARVARFEGGWSVEMRIPFRSLRYRLESPTWGIQIGRSIKWKNEITFVSPLPVVSGPPVYRISYGATLTGLRMPSPSGRPTIKPWTTAGINTEHAANAGVDVRSAIGRGFTAEVTANTDFAQVEEDEQQINLTRFALFFPEKRDFFLEGQGVFTFGGQGTTAASDVPIMFFSRTIGFGNGRPQDILGGARLTGKAGKYAVGVVDVQTRDMESTGARGGNTSVVRLRRDVLGNSTVGLLFTNRSQSVQHAGRNSLAGIDGVFTFLTYLRVNTYAARTDTDGTGGDGWSYRAQLDYAADRYGVMVDRLNVGSEFNADAGFMRRRAFTKNAIGLRFSPRPRAGGALSRRVRKFSYEAAYNHYERIGGGLDSSDVSLIARSEFQNGDTAQLQLTANADQVPAPFAVAPGLDVPVGRYDWRSVQGSYVLGARRRISGTVSALTGSFYTGAQRILTYRGRVSVATRLVVEPSLSVNHIALGAREATATLVGNRVTTPLTPRMFASALVQYNSLDGSYSSSVRFRWEYQPGSEVIVVYTGTSARRTGMTMDDGTRALALKITRTFGQ